MKYIVEIIVCEYDEDGTRWKADGTVLSEHHTRNEAEAVAVRLRGHAARADAGEAQAPNGEA